MATVSSHHSKPHLQALDTMKPVENEEIESGYASATSSFSSSASSSTTSLPQITLTKPHLRYLNQQMEKMTPLERIRFSMHLFPNLYQTTAFGLTGLVTIDMLSKLATSDSTLPRVDAIFLDTLYHFRETYDLVSRVQERYPAIKLHVFKPDGTSTASEFESLYGEQLYDTASELYDWIAKVEPQQRAYAELNVAAVFTGRRRSQGGERDKIPILEVDDERGIVKINPLLDWSFAQVKAYITENDVPYNALLDQGYKSVGDWHSTSPVAAGEDERAGRWKGQQKTECGIHNKKSRYAQFLLEQKLKDAAAAAEAAEATVEVQEELTSALEKVEREREQQQELRQDFATGCWVPVL
ncbi:phosphoadenosine phosphosulfate reductase [Xylaria bambusicola]|uniref:phosphoadenosine phosphosulfate reductase n=1 Tax=Xylaria bambusicola TaxID=326684 RepID=UPI002007D23D|nr:phosphoadenosine phosphosulfate reductase [Xylaria bambusicola]KAI0521159.1 phosphoadenosine phosphosulfate reductase [Xylaria bambusicola]